ncbi:MAG: hypothetical protein AB8B85_18755 [Paracoccaceae bacterium]
MKSMRLAAIAAAFLLAACAPVPEGAPFPQGAKPHGPYLDRSFEGYMVRAAYVDDITVVSVQATSEAPEPSLEHFSKARAMLKNGTAIDPDAEGGNVEKAAEFEATAKLAAGTPGWCPYETQFAYLEPIPTRLEYRFGIRGSYHGEIAAFVFAGQCR